MSRRFKGSFDNGCSWDKVPEAPINPENWTNPSVPPMSTEDLGNRFYEGVPSYIQGSEMPKGVTQPPKHGKSNLPEMILDKINNKDVTDSFGVAEVINQYQESFGLEDNDPYIESVWRWFKMNSNKLIKNRDNSVRKGSITGKTGMGIGRRVKGGLGDRLGGLDGARTRNEDMPQNFDSDGIVPQIDWELPEARRTAKLEDREMRNLIRTVAATIGYKMDSMGMSTDSGINWVLTNKQDDLEIDIQINDDESVEINLMTLNPFRQEILGSSVIKDGGNTIRLIRGVKDLLKEVGELSLQKVAKMNGRRAMKFDTKKEIQDYKREHDVKPGTKMEVRNEQEMKERRSGIEERVAAGFLVYPDEGYYVAKDSFKMGLGSWSVIIRMGSLLQVKQMGNGLKLLMWSEVKGMWSEVGTPVSGSNFRFNWNGRDDNDLSRPFLRNTRKISEKELKKYLGENTVDRVMTVSEALSLLSARNPRDSVYIRIGK